MVGAIVGAIVGACAGVDAFSAERLEEVARVNGLDLDSVAERLLRLRARTADGRGAKEA
jgi:ADP-ribosylglycohydrolase